MRTEHNQLELRTDTQIFLVGSETLPHVGPFGQCLDGQIHQSPGWHEMSSPYLLQRMPALPARTSCVIALLYVALLLICCFQPVETVNGFIRANGGTKLLFYP